MNAPKGYTELKRALLIHYVYLDYINGIIVALTMRYFVIAGDAQNNRFGTGYQDNGKQPITERAKEHEPINC